MLVRWQGQNGLPTGQTSQGPIIPWYASAQFNSATPLNGLGSLWYDDVSGNVFQYVKASVALAAGQLVSPVVPGTDTVVAASSTTQVVTLNTGGLTANAEVGNYIYFGTLATMRLIKANTATTVTVSLTTSILGNNQPDPDVLPAIPANNENVSIIRPYNVKVCTQVLQPTGVALGVVTALYYTMVQVAGLALVLTTGTGTATVVNVPAVTGAAGVAIGGGGTAFAYTAGVSMLPQYASAGTAVLTPMIVNFMGA